MSELREFVDSTARPILIANGFRKTAPVRYEVTSDAGASVVIAFQARAGTGFQLFIPWGAFPSALNRYYREVEGKKHCAPHAGIVAANLYAPLDLRLPGFPLAHDLWYREPGLHDRFRDRFVEDFESRAVPFLLRMLEPESLAQAVREEPSLRITMSHVYRSRVWFPYVLNLDTGDPVEMIKGLDELADEDHTDLSRWMRAQLIERAKSAEEPKPDGPE